MINEWICAIKGWAKHNIGLFAGLTEHETESDGCQTRIDRNPKPANAYSEIGMNGTLMPSYKLLTC